MTSLPEPPAQAIIYQDAKLYVCLASFPLTRGHTVVVWKKAVKDINLLDRGDYEHLMFIVEKCRKAVMAALSAQKVYLLYMDEVNHVHWHLVPRYKEKGITVLNHKPEKLEDFSLAARIQKNWT